MRRRLQAQDGMTLIELLVAMTMATIVFGATLAVVTVMIGNAQRNQRANDAQDQARTYIDRLARQLRNLASPSLFTDPNDPNAAVEQKPAAVDMAGAYDFIFRVVDDTMPAGSLNTANVKRVRYCLDNSDPTNEVLYQQQQTWTNRASYDPPPIPSTAACPGAGWSTTTRVTGSLVNRINGQDRAVFRYDSIDITKVSEVRPQLFIDTTPNSGPTETRLSTGVTLRNQNRAPVASMNVTVTSPGNVLLNGSASDDPEGQPLHYWWYVDPPTPLPDCTVTPRPPSCLAAEGVVISATVSRGSSHTIVLLVKDPAGLAGSASDSRYYP
jgi:prepilin-type N-terminal cleavage/methylation domain-containing protein